MSMKNNLVCLITLCFALAFLVIGCDSKEEKEAKNCEDEVTAYVMAIGFLKDRLRSPSTAEFPWASTGRVTYLGICRHRVRSYVDAQNAFGAVIRNDWVAVVRYKGDEIWVLENIELY